MSDIDITLVVHAVGHEYTGVGSNPSEAKCFTWWFMHKQNLPEIISYRGGRDIACGGKYESTNLQIINQIIWHGRQVAKAMPKVYLHKSLKTPNKLRTKIVVQNLKCRNSSLYKPRPPRMVTKHQDTHQTESPKLQRVARIVFQEKPGAPTNAPEPTLSCAVS